MEIREVWAATPVSAKRRFRSTRSPPKLVRRLACHGSTFSRVGASGNPGAVQSGFGILISFDNFSLSLFITQGNTLPLRLMLELLAYADPSIATNATLLILIPIVGKNFLLPRAFRTRA
jgi:hypothetical protein